MREIMLKVFKALRKSYGEEEAMNILTELVDEIGELSNGRNKMDKNHN